MRAFCIMGLALLISGAAAPSAQASDTVVFVKPNGYAQELANQSRQPTAAMAHRLEGMLDTAMQAKSVDKVSLVIHCDHYAAIESMYRDGTLRVVSVTGNNERVDGAELAKLQALYPSLKITDSGC